ncbi:MAG: CPBP family intramembrane metalloprotease [Myxococcales bacterium]|nr:CPBP family intramembrane metalloprotease [Myxococcales bacterium]
MRSAASEPGESAVVLREVLLAGLSVAIVFVVLAILISTGALPNPQHGEGLQRALGFLYSPLSLLAGAGLYGLLSRLLDGEVTPPLLPAEQPPPAVAAVGVALLHVALAILGSFAIGLALQVVGVPVVEQTQVLEITAGGLGLRPELLLLAFTALIAAPIAEESLLRGLLFRRLWLQAGPRTAYLVSALAFAAIHGNLRGLLVYFWLGLVFARAYALTGRLACAVVAHVGNNAVTLAVLLFGGSANAAP